MKNNKLLAILMTLMITLGLAPFISTANADPTILYVDDNYSSSTPGWGIDHFNTIQEAVNHSVDNDTIWVYGGTYSENIEIYNFTSLKILADKSGSSVFVTPPFNLDPAINIKSDGVKIDGFDISGQIFTIHCSGDFNKFSNNIIHGSYPAYGIMIDGDDSMGNTIFKNKIYNGTDGIMIDNADSTVISKNEIFQVGTGISIRSYDVQNNTNNNIIKNNNIYNVTSWGILLYNNGGLLKNNVISHNNIHTPNPHSSVPGIDLYSYLGFINNTKIIHNTVDGYLYCIHNTGNNGIIHHNIALNIVYIDYLDGGVGNKVFKNSWN